MWLIVGLGNPGTKYAETRHNIGFEVVDKLAGRWAIQVDKRKFDGRTGGGTFRQEQVLLLKPETFMNLSGQSVRAALDFYKLEPKDLLVIVDDLALPVGQIRVRPQGSAGGHNGLSDIIQKVGTDRFGRVRIGIGSPPPRMDSADYVLGRFGSQEKVLIGQAVEKASDAVESILTVGMAKTMEAYNRAQAQDNPEGSGKDRTGDKNI